MPGKPKNHNLDLTAKNTVFVQGAGSRFTRAGSEITLDFVFVVKTQGAALDSANYRNGNLLSGKLFIKAASSLMPRKSKCQNLERHFVI